MSTRRGIANTLKIKFDQARIHALATVD